MCDYKGMESYDKVIDQFTQKSLEIQGENLVGVYLHGSAVMGCFQPKKSDLDFIVVVKDAVPDVSKKSFMEMVTKLNAEGPAKGIEMSIVRRDYLLKCFIRFLAIWHLRPRIQFVIQLLCIFFFIYAYHSLKIWIFSFYPFVYSGKLGVIIDTI